ncbi:MAG: LysM peptidoglycan-binding domain-containing protein [Thermodesulfobacteriota bacterium]
MAARRLVILVAALFLLAAPRPSLSDTTYTVGKGDTLSRIAKRFHLPVKKLKEANDLRSNRIVAGEKLRIPQKEKAVAKRAEKRARKSGKASAPAAPARPAPAQLHTVRKGETLGSISRRYDVPERELRRRNLLKKGKRLRPGTQIVVRAELPESYEVREDDTLSGIARKFSLSTDEIMARNGLDTDLLVPGQELALTDPPEAADPAVEGTARFVTVEELIAAAQPLPPAQDAQDSAEEMPQSRIVRVAKKMISIPYVWGGTSLTGFDCSGFVRMVFGLLNLDLPRSAREQFGVGRDVDRGDLSIGDLVFFQTYAKYPSHVGIYLGDNRFIHASSGARRVNITSMDHPYYVKRYIGARRLLYATNDVVN